MGVRKRFFDFCTAFLACLVSALLSVACFPPEVAAQELNNLPISSHKMKAVRGQPIERDASIVVILTTTGFSQEYFTFRKAKDQDALADGPLIDAPPGWRVRVIRSVVTKVPVKYARHLQAEYKGEGYEIRSRVEFYSMKEVNPGKHSVTVSFPKVNVLGQDLDPKRRMIGVEGLQGRKDPGFDFEIELYPTEKDLKAADDAVLLEQKRQRQEEARIEQERTKKQEADLQQAAKLREEQTARDARNSRASLILLIAIISLSILLIFTYLVLLVPQAHSASILISEESALPEKCMCCGVAATCRFPHVFRWSPWYGTGLLALLFFLATFRSVTINMPFCDRHQGYWSLRRLLMFIGVGLFGIYLVVPLYFLSLADMTLAASLTWIACTMLTPSIVMLITSQTSIRAGEVSDNMVLLYGVSEVFAGVSQSPSNHESDDNGFGDSYGKNQAARCRTCGVLLDSDEKSVGFCTRCAKRG